MSRKHKGINRNDNTLGRRRDLKSSIKSLNIYKGRRQS